MFFAPFSQQAMAVDGTGGTITHSGGNTIHTFTSTGTFTPSVARTVSVYAVAGGGGGGAAGSTGYASGGGGGGGVVNSASDSVTVQAYTVTVGGGGAGGAWDAGNTDHGDNGQNGGNSIFNDITAVGGGGGGGNYVSKNGSNGGSGGGGGMYSPGTGGTGTAGQGNAGGASSGTSGGVGAGGGGGGAGGAGGSGTTSTGGAAGNGVNPGSGIFYGGGGAGAGSSTNGSAGSSGGTAASAVGATNRGAGGGGSYKALGKAGGSGIVIISYPTNIAPNAPAINAPGNGTTGQSLTAVLQTTTTDLDADYIRYKIQIATNAGFTTGLQTFDETSSQTGWSGQNTQSTTAYTSGTQGVYTIQSALAPNTLYYIRSYAIDPAGTNTWSAASTATSFTTNAAPSAPTVNAPSNGATGQLLSPVITTTATDPQSDYIRYKIQIATDNGFTQNVQTFDETSSQTGWSGQNANGNLAYSSGTQGVYTVQAPLSQNKLYYVRSYAIDPAGSNSWSSASSTISFTTVSNPPNTPTLDSPANNAVQILNSPVFKTTASDPNSDYVRYKIQIATDIGITQNVQTFDETSSQTGWSGQNTQGNTAYTSGSQATYTLQTTLSGNTIYYWRSYAIDPGGTNAWSSTQTAYKFTTRASDCSAIPGTAGATTSISSASCAIPGSGIVGLDSGTGTTNTAQLQIGSGGNLTVMYDQTLAVGSISFSGGSIAILSGGTIKVGVPLYLTDNDGDGVGVPTTTYLTPAIGRARRSAGIDCNDSDPTKWQNINAYVDADHDGHGTGSSSPICTGATLPVGYAADNTDCNDNSALVFSSTTCYKDIDSDGYTSGTVTCTNNSSCASATYGAVGTAAPVYLAGKLLSTAGSGTDCNDTGANSNKVHASNTCYLDSDGDTYGTGSAYACTDNSTCGTSTWASGADGTASTSFTAGKLVTNNTDCNDTGTNSSHVYISATCYVDGDDDGWGSATSKTCMDNATCTSAAWGSGGQGTAAVNTNFSANNTDCSDTHYSLANVCLPTRYGDGHDGAVTISGSKNIELDAIEAGRTVADGDAIQVSAIGTNTVTVTGYSTDNIAATAIGGTAPNIDFASGDEVMLINLQGDNTNYGNVGNYEFLLIDHVTSSTVTFLTNIVKSYGVGGNSNLTGQYILIQRVPDYTNITINSGATLTTNGWANGDGIIAFRANGTAAINGTIAATGLGYPGPTGTASGWSPGGASFCGLGVTGGSGAGNTSGTTANIDGICGGGGGGTEGVSGGTGSSTGGAGGGGGYAACNGCNQGRTSASAGGAGYGTFGTGGTPGDASGGTGVNGGTNTSGKGGGGGRYTCCCTSESCTTTKQFSGGGGGGGTYGVADLSDIFLGSSGGAGGSALGNAGGHGGNGGGIVHIAASTLTVSGTGAITSNGNSGVAGGSSAGGGGGGSGGSIFMTSNNATLGSSLITATGGTGAGPAGTGGTGGVGRIRLNYQNAYSGTTNPAISASNQ